MDNEAQMRERSMRPQRKPEKLLCRLTLELSGGEAVRLERDVRRHRAELAEVLLMRL